MPWGAGTHYAKPADWEQRRQKIFHRAGRICHLCGHDGADQIDHVINATRWMKEHRPGSPHQLANLAPIHGGVCPVCGHDCHKAKTQDEAIHGAKAWKKDEEIHPGIRHSQHPRR